MPQVDAAINAALRRDRRSPPAGVRYASLRLPDEVTAIILLKVDDAGQQPAPLPQIEPSIRKATAPRCARCSSNPAAIHS